ncbi:hypothetical protein [Streptomyces sp. NPDC058297]|uniref:hypothetical protein n=1 Tax=unclassified Streptomyces TaxID=2593676 RepID=UPI0036EF69F5
MKIPDVIDGVAAVEEPAVTGESAPVLRESGATAALTSKAIAEEADVDDHLAEATTEDELALHRRTTFCGAI